MPGGDSRVQTAAAGIGAAPTLRGGSPAGTGHRLRSDVIGHRARGIAGRARTPSRTEHPEPCVRRRSTWIPTRGGDRHRVPRARSQTEGWRGSRPVVPGSGTRRAPRTMPRRAVVPAVSAHETACIERRGTPDQSRRSAAEQNRRAPGPGKRRSAIEAAGPTSGMLIALASTRATWEPWDRGKASWCPGLRGRHASGCRRRGHGVFCWALRFNWLAGQRVLIHNAGGRRRSCGDPGLRQAGA